MGGYESYKNKVDVVVVNVVVVMQTAIMTADISQRMMYRIGSQDGKIWLS